jgi:hypothetical protein
LGRSETGRFAVGGAFPLTNELEGVEDNVKDASTIDIVSMNLRRPKTSNAPVSEGVGGTSQA